MDDELCSVSHVDFVPLPKKPQQILFINLLREISVPPRIDGDITAVVTKVLNLDYPASNFYLERE